MNPDAQERRVRIQRIVEMLSDGSEDDVMELIRIGQLIPPDQRRFTLKHLRRILSPILDFLEPNKNRNDYMTQTMGKGIL